MAENLQEKELITQLSSDKRSLVIQAIVKLTRIGRTKDSIQALVPLLNSSDREISFFSFQAAGKIAQKAGVDLQELIKDYQPAQESGENLTREELLSTKAEKGKETLFKVRRLYDKISDELLPSVAVFLRRYGDVSDAPFLEKCLANESSNLALPFIEAAEKIAPQALARNLPHLLASKEPLVRSRSVSALRRIDPEEAERHFSDLLASRNPEDRLAGIAIAFLFPFQRVKGYILSLLPEERDADVLKACQTFLASNPELDSALGILDSIDSVSPEQKGRLTIIFKTVCQALGTTGIMDAEKARPEEIVKMWKQQRLEAFLNDLEIQLSFSDEKKKAAIVAWIEKNRNHPKVRELIERLARNPQTEKVFQQLTRPVQSKKDQDSETQAKPMQKQQAIPDDDRQKIKKMRGLELENLPANKSWLLKEAENGKPLIRKEALSTLLRLHPDNKLLDLAKQAIDNPDQGVKIAAFQILERLDNEFLKENIATFMQEDDPNIRLRAIRFALKFKESEAIEILKSLLKSSEHRIRANAVACLGLCPFSSAYKILMDQLDEESHPVIAKHITSILLSNPSKAVLKGLDNITRTSNPAVAMVVSQARNDLFELLEKLPEEAIQEPVKIDAKSESKPYSVENVRNIARSRQKVWKPGYKAEQNAKTKESLKSSLNWQMILSGAVVIVFLAMLPIMLLSDRGKNDYGKVNRPKDWRDNERKKFSRSKIPANLRMNRPCSIPAVVEKVTSDSSMVVKHEDQQIMIKFETPETKNITPGTELVVTMVPFRVNPRGIIQARGTSLAISKGQE